MQECVFLFPYIHVIINVTSLLNISLNILFPFPVLYIYILIILILIIACILHIFYIIQYDINMRICLLNTQEQLIRTRKDYCLK
jgi:glucan phosphoethanolaminetransferase (alkaline phosphatase superfamily)